MMCCLLTVNSFYLEKDAPHAIGLDIPVIRIEETLRWRSDDAEGYAVERIGHDVDEIRRIREHGGSVAFYRGRKSPVQVRFGVGIGCRAHFFEELVRFRVYVHRDIESGVVPLRGMPECIEITIPTDDLAEEKRIILARADFVLVQIPRFENFHF